MSTDTKKDFFVSYNRHDKAWAEWIAWILEESGYTVVIHAWDFRPGGNFVLDMHDAIDNTRRTIAVLSPNYLRSEFAQPEWAAAFVQDPKGKNRTLIPVRVEACELTGLLRALVYVDLVGVAKAEAQELLLRAVSDERTKPSRSSEFPQLGIPANLPLANQLFVGREQALEELHLQVRSGELTAISSIKGMGGIGKTELALQYALKHLKAQDYPGGVCWLKAREDIGLQIVQFAREKLGMIPPDDRELMAQVEWCWTNWQKAATLLVFDDVQAYADIQSFLPKHRDQFRVLLTTRKYLDGSVRNYEIQVLSEAASLELLQRLVSDGRIEQDLETAKRVCEWLGYLPLGLELVGRYLARKKGCSVAKLWERLQDDRLEAIALQKVEAGMTATLNVIKAFELSWQELNADAQRLAALLSLFALAEIPRSLVQQCLPEADEEELEDLLDEQLVNLSLLSFEGGENYQLHQLLREFFAWKRSQMPEDEEWKRSFCRVMNEIAQQITSTVTLSVIEKFMPVIFHIKEAVTTLSSYLRDGDLTGMSDQIARFYQGQSAFGESEKWYQYSCMIASERFGNDHPFTAISLNNLGDLYRLQGQYEKAKLLFLRSVLIQQQHLGNDDPLVAVGLGNLAELYRLQGQYEKAEFLQLKSLGILQQKLGNDHPNIAIGLNNLALLYKSQGRYGEAEPLFVRSLSIAQQHLGDNHPDVARSMNNLGFLYNAQGRYKEAEPLFVQSLSIWEQQLGKDHPDVALSLNNLAELYRAQGRYKEAEPLYLRSLSIKQQLLEKDHPDVALSLNNLAELYRAQGRYKEAEPLFVQSLEIYQRQLGNNHPYVAISTNNLACLYQAQGRYKEAKHLYDVALGISKQALGEDHPDVAIRLINLANLQAIMGNYSEAEQLHLQGISIRCKKLGRMHPVTLGTMLDFSRFLYQVLQVDRTSELSDHPMTRSLLQQLQNEEL